MLAAVIALYLLGPRAPTELTGHCGVFVGSTAYVAGGSSFANMGRFYSELWKIDLAGQMWTKLGDLRTPRAMAGMAYLNGSLYVAGGFEFSNAHLRSVEKFDLKSGKWSNSAPMLNPRSRFSLVALNGKLYAVGGMRGLVSPLNTTEVEEYDPTANRWRVAGHTLKARHGYAAVVFGGRIGIFGGYAEAETDSCELWDPKSGKSRELPSMPTRRGFEAAVLDGETVVCFGGRPAASHPTAFDTRTLQWSNLATPDIDVNRTVCGRSGGKIWLVGGEHASISNLPILRRLDGIN